MRQKFHVCARSSFAAAAGLGLVLMAAPVASAQDGAGSDAVVATADEPVHHVIFENDYVRIMRVLIMPHTSTMWHEQHLDYVNTPLNGTPVRIEYKNAPTKNTVMPSLGLRFGAHAGKSETDRVTNTGDTVNQQVAFEIKKNGPQNFGPSDRTKNPAFKMILDKPAVRGWHVHLEPGQSTGEYTQSGPGVRVIFGGVRLMTKYADKVVAEQTPLQFGDDFYLEPGRKTVINGSDKPLDYNEFELR